MLIGTSTAYRYNVSGKGTETDFELIGEIEETVDRRERKIPDTLYVQAPWNPVIINEMSTVEWQRLLPGRHTFVQRVVAFVTAFKNTCSERNMTITELSGLYTRAFEFIGSLHRYKNFTDTTFDESSLTRLRHFVEDMGDMYPACLNTPILLPQCIPVTAYDKRFNTAMQWIHSKTFIVKEFRHPLYAKSIPGSPDMKFKRDQLEQLRKAYQNPALIGMTTEWLKASKIAPYKTQEYIFQTMMDIERDCTEIQFTDMETFINVWADLVTYFPTYVSEVMTTLDSYTLDEVTPDKVPFSVQDPQTVEYRLQQLFKTKLDTQSAPNLLSIFFDGLQTTGMTGMAVSKHSLGNLLSGVTSLIGYFGQAGLLINQINNPPTTDKTAEKYWNAFADFNARTGSKKCVSPDETPLVMVGHSLMENDLKDKMRWVDTIPTELVFTTGHGIVNSGAYVGCFDTGMKSLTVSDSTVLSWAGRYGLINYWKLTNIDKHFETHSQLEFTCGSDVMLIVRGNKVFSKKNWVQDISRPGDDFDTCDQNPLGKINWMLDQGCPMAPKKIITGHYTCGQLLTSAQKDAALTDVSHNQKLKVFTFNKTSWEFDPDQNIVNRSSCVGYGVSQCTWPERLWLYDTVTKQRTFNVWLGQNINSFSFTCPSGSQVSISENHETLTWTVDAANLVTVRALPIEAALGQLSMTCTAGYRVTDKFIFNHRSKLIERQNDTITSIGSAKYGPEYFGDNINVLWAFDPYKNTALLKDAFMEISIDSNPMITTTVWEGGEDISTFMFTDSSKTYPLSCYMTIGMHTYLKCENIKYTEKVKITLKTKALVFWTTTLVFLTPKDITETKNNIVPETLWEQYLELQALIELTTTDFSTIINTVKKASWPGMITATATQIIEDWNAAKTNEAQHKSMAYKKMVELWRKMKELVTTKTGDDLDTYCCILSPNTYTPQEFWTSNQWTCDYNMWTIQGNDRRVCDLYDCNVETLMFDCFSKIGIDWPIDLLRHHDNILQGNILIQSLSDYVFTLDYILAISKAEEQLQIERENTQADEQSKSILDQIDVILDTLPPVKKTNYALYPIIGILMIFGSSFIIVGIIIIWKRKQHGWFLKFEKTFITSDQIKKELSPLMAPSLVGSDESINTNKLT